jgi:hypothetical protein
MVLAARNILDVGRIGHDQLEVALADSHVDAPTEAAHEQEGIPARVVDAT